LSDIGIVSIQAQRTNL